MTQIARNITLIFLCSLGLSGSSSFGRGGPQSAPSGQSGSSTAQTAPANTAPPTVPDSKKKKVWTNEDVSGLNGPVSVVGNAKNGKGTTGADGSADGQYIASTKKQLEKLQGQIDDAKKQITALKDFQQGKAPEPAGYPLGKGYNRVPVDQQIANLEEKKKDWEQKISDLLDEARKKGVLPGQLR